MIPYTEPKALFCIEYFALSEKKVKNKFSSILTKNRPETLHRLVKYII